MNTPVDPIRPSNLDPDTDPDTRGTPYRAVERREGWGAIIAVVAVAAVVIVGLLYIMGDSPQEPARVTTEAPSVVTPPAQTPSPPPVAK